MTERYRPYKIFFDFPCYIEARDKLIPAAEALATKVCGGRPEEPATTFHGKMALQEWGDTWSYIFHQKMNLLAIEAGLCQER